MSLKPIYYIFKEESLSEAVEKINKIFGELFDNNRYISYMSFKITNGIPHAVFIQHFLNVREPLRYNLKVLELPDDGCLAQQVLENEFLSVQNHGWYIKSCKMIDTCCTMFLQRVESARGLI